MIALLKKNQQQRKLLLAANICGLLFGTVLSLKIALNLPCGVFCMVIEPEACPATVQEAGRDNAQVDPALILASQSNQKGQ